MTLTVLILALAPSLFPTWRNMLIAAGAMYVLLLIAFFYLLRRVDTLPMGEGPAFFGAVLLYGFATAILIGSCLFKLIITFVFPHIRPVIALWLRRIIIVTGALIAALLAYAVSVALVSRGFAVLAGSASVWLSLVTWLMPNNSFKPTPPCGAA